MDPLYSPLRIRRFSEGECDDDARAALAPAMLRLQVTGRTYSVEELLSVILQAIATGNQHLEQSRRSDRRAAMWYWLAGTYLRIAHDLPALAGRWQEWCRASLPISRRTADRWIQVASQYNLEQIERHPKDSLRLLLGMGSRRRQPDQPDGDASRGRGGGGKPLGLLHHEARRTPDGIVLRLLGADGRWTGRLMTVEQWRALRATVDPLAGQQDASNGSDEDHIRDGVEDQPTPDTAAQVEDDAESGADDAPNSNQRDDKDSDQHDEDRGDEQPNEQPSPSRKARLPRPAQGDGQPKKLLLRATTITLEPTGDSRRPNVIGQLTLAGVANRQAAVCVVPLTRETLDQLVDGCIDLENVLRDAPEEPLPDA
jgi:hypothetical protein